MVALLRSVKVATPPCAAKAAQLVKNVFFDKLSAVFQNLKSSEKPVIANERHP